MLSEDKASIKISTEIYNKARLFLDCARAQGATVSCAESCTGGLVSAALSAVPGSSDVLLGGVVSYALDVKKRLLCVEENILSDPLLGPVSKECALAMAKGVRELTGSILAVSVTGIAGPSGEEPGKPVGTVWLACAGPSFSKAQLLSLEGTRAEIRSQAVEEAISLLHEACVSISSSR